MSETNEVSDTPTSMPADMMFTDSEGAQWNLKINLGTARLIDNSNYDEVTKIPFSFLNPSRDFFGEVFANTQLSMALIWTIIQKQVPKVMGVTIAPDNEAYDKNDPSIVSYDQAESMFLDRLDGNAIKDGKEALLKALADFFPDQRTVLLSFQSKFAKIQKRMEMEMRVMSTQLDDVLEERMNKELKTFRRNAEDLKDGLGGNSSSVLAK